MQKNFTVKFDNILQTTWNFSPIHNYSWVSKNKLFLRLMTIAAIDDVILGNEL